MSDDFKVGDTIYTAGYRYINKTIVLRIDDDYPVGSGRRYYTEPANGFTGGYAPMVFKCLGEAIIYARKKIDKEFDEAIDEITRQRNEAHIELNGYIAEIASEKDRPIKTFNDLVFVSSEENDFPTAKTVICGYTLTVSFYGKEGADYRYSCDARSLDDGSCFIYSGKYVEMPCDGDLILTKKEINRLMRQITNKTQQ